MKQFLITMGFLLIFSGLSKAQLTSPTTEEEYNYGAVGYKIQLNNKLDVKEGYRLEAMEGCEESDRKIEYQVMYRQKDAKPCGVILIYTKMRNPPQYYCIPTANASPALWDKFYKSLIIGSDNPADQLQFFSSCIARLMMNFAAK